MLLQTKEIAGIFGVSAQAVNGWGRAGCPKAGRGAWNIKAVLGWWLENIYAERVAGDDEQLSEAKRRYWSSKADREKMRVDQERGELITKDEVVKYWAQRVAEYKSGLYGLVHSLPPLLEGQDQAVMRRHITATVDGMFDRVCREGQFCPRPDLTDEQILKIWKEGINA